MITPSDVRWRLGVTAAKWPDEALLSPAFIPAVTAELEKCIAYESLSNTDKAIAKALAVDMVALKVLTKGRLGSFSADFVKIGEEPDNAAVIRELKKSITEKQRLLGIVGIYAMGEYGDV